ncbi:MAG: alternative ribosome rescue aminoacyl-tRNA hydrolase ArfB [Candidatus Berkiella sp.]
MFRISPEISIKNAEIAFSFIRSPGPGGQNVNKVSTAVVLRFNINTSTSLSDEIKENLYKKFPSKITANGEIIIKASRYRTQLSNKEDALTRLALMIIQAAHKPKKRLKSKPSKAAKQKRLDAKKIHSQKKSSRKLNKDLD